MNPALDLLRPYPFERLRALLGSTQAPAGLPAVNLSIGEPRHATPALLLEALARSLPSISTYPATRGTDALREAIAAWLARRYGLRAIDPQRQVLPVNGSREALFAFAQAVCDARGDDIVVVPNPGYQIYEGAALLARATVRYLPLDPADHWRMPLERVPQAEWPRVRLVYVCSPGNPTGAVMSLAQWRELFELADRHDFIIAADECYSEVHAGNPPLGALAAAQQLGRDDYARLVSFSSLSKRSNAPGLRSGFVAGDAAVLERFLAYRTYHGCAMSPAVQAASIAAWNDEEHVRENCRRYAAKFRAVQARIAEVLPTDMPDAGFYLWARTPGDDAAYVLSLYRDHNVLLLPGSFLAREVDGHNPGAGYVRIALVAEEKDVELAAARIQAHGAGGGGAAPGKTGERP